MTYDGYFERKTSENHSYFILKPKKELRGVRRDKGNDKKYTTFEGIVILGSTGENQGQRRVF